MLLAFAQIADTSSVTKIARNKLQSLSKSHSHTKSARRAAKRSTTLTKKTVMLGEAENVMTLYELFTSILPQVENLFKFVMGFICEHVSEICTIYTKIKQATAVWTNVKTCFETIKTSYTTITKNLDSTTQETLQKVEVQGAKTHGDETLCKTVKVQIKKTFEDNTSGLGAIFGFVATLLLPGSGHVVQGVTNSLVSMSQPLHDIDSMCNSYTDHRKAELIEQFGSLARYKEQCEYFAKQDCSQFNPATVNIKEFFKKVVGIAGAVKESVKCIFDTIKSVTDLFNISEIIGKWLAKLAAKIGINIAANVLTLGIWAGIKAAYYIVKLGIKIYKFIVAWKAGNADVFELGRIIANAGDIIQSLMAMRRKRKLMK